jgi:hypothetical protein
VSAGPFSEVWWATEAFAGAPDAGAPERRAARRVCERYGIRGTADPAYIANVLVQRREPPGASPTRPEHDSACRFLIRIYPALAAAAVPELLELVTEAIVAEGR